MSKQQLKLIIAGESFDVQVDDYRVTTNGFNMSFGVDFEFEEEDQRRLQAAMYQWQQEKSEIIIEGRSA